MGPYRSSSFLMDSNWSLCVLKSRYNSLSVAMGPYRSFGVFMDSNVSKCVFISPYASIFIVMGPHGCLWFFFCGYGF